LREKKISALRIWKIRLMTKKVMQLGISSFIFKTHEKNFRFSLSTLHRSD
jgi:hypothetical protein